MVLKSNNQKGNHRRRPPAIPDLNRVGIKLSLAMGLLLCLFVIAALASYLEMRQVGIQVRRIAEEKEPASAASYEMEINAIETGAGVLQYLDTGDPSHQQRVLKDGAGFLRFKAQYDLLVQTPQGQNLGRRLDRLYQEYLLIGKALMAQRDQQDALYTVILENLETVRQGLDERMLSGIDPQDPVAMEKELAAATLESNVLEIGAQLGAYLGTGRVQYRQRLFNNASQYQQQLAWLSRLPLSEDERAWSQELEANFNQAWTTVQEMITLRDSTEQNLTRFFALREQMDDLLDGEIQVEARQKLTEATGEAQEVIRQTNIMVLGLLLAGLVGGGVVAVAITGGITRPMGKLVAATRRVAAGDLTQRVAAKSGDELGFLGKAFNDMVARRQEAEAALLQAQQGLERRVEERTSELAQANGTLSAINGVVQALTSTLDIGQVYERFTQEVKKLVDFDRITINSIEPDTNTFTFRFVSGITAPGYNAGDQIKLEGTLTEMLLRTGRSQVRPDIAASPRFRGSERLLQMGLRAGIIVPLSVKGRTIGALSLQSCRAQAYGPREQQLLEQLAVPIASTVGNLQVYQELGRRTGELAEANRIITGMNELSRIITATPDIGQVYDQFAQEVKKLVDFDRISINTINREEGAFVYQHVSGLALSGRSRGDSMPLAGSQLEKAILTGRSQIRSDIATGPDKTSVTIMAQAGVRSSILVPLVVNGGVIGGLGLWSRRPGAFGPPEQEILGRLSRQIAPVIQNAQLFKDAQRETQRANTALAKLRAVEEMERRRNLKLEAQFTIAQILSRPGDSREKPTLVLKELLAVAQADSINLRVRDDQEQGLRLVAEFGRAEPDFRPSPVRPFQESLPGMALKTGHPMVANDYAAHPLATPNGVARGIKSLLAAPVKSRSMMLGVVTFHSRELNHFTPERVELLSAVMSEVGVMLEHDRLYQDAVKEKERATAALAQLNSVLESVDAGIILVAGDNQTVLWTNRRMLELIGAGDLTPLFGSPRCGEEMTRLLLPLLERPAEFFGEIERIYKDRRYVGVTDNIHLRGPQGRVVRQFTAPVHDGDGQYQGRLWVITDVTEQQRLESQMRQTQKMDTVGRLAGGVAHDFNNLLTAILGYAQLGISGMSEDHPSAGHFREVEKAAQRAAGLTRQLLAFSRHQVVEATEVDLNQIIMGMHGMLRRLIGEDVELATLPAPDLAQVKADAGQMEQVVMNLVVNARDAMPNGGKITIRTKNVVVDQWQAAEIPGASAGMYVMLSIADTGAGMTEEVKAHLFEPFFTTKALGQGTGLGLATCYGIIRRAEGHIQVESRVGHGATIKIYLPWVASGEAARSRKQEGDDLQHRGTETVLVADDEPEMRASMARTLSELGYTVLEAGDGEEARRVAWQHRGNKINLLVADMVMPKLGGVELAREFRADRPEAKVLFVSGYSDDPMLAQDGDHKGRDFMQKPFLPATLARKVRELLDRP